MIIYNFGHDGEFFVSEIEMAFHYKIQRACKWYAHVLYYMKWDITIKQYTKLKKKNQKGYRKFLMHNSWLR